MKYRYLILLCIIFLKIIEGHAQSLFFDAFENNLENWEYHDSSLVQLHLTQDSDHKSVLKLIPNKTSDCILIKNSQKWDSVAIEGRVLFPTKQHNYLGIVYNYQKKDRTDFGCLYIKGNGNYVRVNPHRDGNASRALYEEFKTKLIGEQSIKINEWISFKAEIIGTECHFFVKNMNIPIVKFKHFEYPDGKLGFKPRFTGGECWLDDISVKKIDRFSRPYEKGQDSIRYDKEQMLYNWQAIGPFNERIQPIESSETDKKVLFNKIEYNWFQFNSDERGCMVVGKLSRYSNDKKYVYFSTTIKNVKEVKGKIQFSSLNNLHVWVNTRYIGIIEKQKYAWYDFYRNSAHEGRNLPVSLKQGENRILVLVEGANYSGDGFYSHLKKY